MKAGRLQGQHHSWRQCSEAKRTAHPQPAGHLHLWGLRSSGGGLVTRRLRLPVLRHLGCRRPVLLHLPHMTLVCVSGSAVQCTTSHTAVQTHDSMPGPSGSWARFLNSWLHRKRGRLLILAPGLPARPARPAGPPSSWPSAPGTCAAAPRAPPAVAGQQGEAPPYPRHVLCSQNAGLSDNRRMLARRAT